MGLAIASLVVSVAVALVVVYRDVIRDWLLKPTLKVQFSLGEPISRQTTVTWPPGAPESVDFRAAFWPRLRVTNTGRRVARNCEAVLAEVRRPDGGVDARYDPLALRWAVAPIERGLEPLDIASGRSVDLNVLTTVDGHAGALIATHAAPVGVPLSLTPGDYWLCVVIYGSNFAPVRRGYAVRWDGRRFREGVAMQEMNCPPSGVDTWPWRPLWQDDT